MCYVYCSCISIVSHSTICSVSCCACAMVRAIWSNEGRFSGTCAQQLEMRDCSKEGTEEGIVGLKLDLAAFWRISKSNRRANSL